jgi:hypothetical protein
MHDPSTYTEAFEREHGCTPAEWLAWLPGAVGAHRWSPVGDGGARVDITGGTLHLHWRPAPPRQIALIRMPRLLVAYRFDGVPAAERVRFMQRFDLYMQRGGG